MTPEAGVITAALNLSNVLLESLQHPKHANILDPLRDEARLLLARWFQAQYRKLIPVLRKRLKAIANVSEASPSPARQAKQVLPDGLLPLAVSSSMAYDYGQILTSTISGAYEQLAAELASDATITEDTMATYLRNNGLRKITGSLNQTTIDRLRNAIADAYEAGADFNGLVDVIKAEYAGFSSVRAQMIAQTELNNAYNFGRKLLGLDLGMTEKSWSCDGPNPCEICLGNQDAGWIPLEDSFPSGDQMPTSHPGCFCSLDLRKGSD